MNIHAENKTGEDDFWDTLPQSQKEDIIKGIEEIENSEIVDYEDFIKKHK